MTNKEAFNGWWDDEGDYLPGNNYDMAQAAWEACSNVHNTWLRHVLEDFKIPFDDHDSGQREALVNWMNKHRNSYTLAKVESCVYAMCSCGGRGPEDNPCPACSVWHLLNGREVK